MYAHNEFLRSEFSNQACAGFVRAKIRQIVKDPVVAAALTPRDHPIGAKRICVATDYFEAYNRDNVTLLDIRKHPLERFTERGLVTDGREYALDNVVFATGFDAMTGALLSIEIHGAGGVSLREKMGRGPENLPGIDDRRIPQPVHHHGSGQSAGA